MANNQKRDAIKARCSKLAELFGAPSQSGLGLELLALRLLAVDPDYANNLSDYDSDPDIAIQQFHSGGPKDCGIDGLLFDAEANRVTLVQCKQTQGAVDETTLSEARDFFGRLKEWAKEGAFKDANTNVRNLIEQSGFDPDEQEVELVFVTTQTGRDDDKHIQLAEDWTTTYQDFGLRVTCTFWVQSDLTERISQADAVHFSQSVPPIKISLPKGNWVHFKDGPLEAIVAAVKGNAIADIYNQTDVKARLFNLNVRAALSGGRINPKIKETAQNPEEAGNFFYYNNGVTATCSEWEIESDEVTFSNLQVVNGAQTVSSLATALKNKNRNSDVYVMLRVIRTGDEYRNKNRVPEQITRFQNTQNPVRVSDFYSNEPLQSWIASALDKRSGKLGFPEVWYEHKRGIKSNKAPGRKKLSLEELAYLRYACLYEAPFTYKSAKDIWSGERNDEAYWKAFGIGGNKCTEWSDEEVSQVGWMVDRWWWLRSQASKLRKEYQNKTKGVDNQTRDDLAATYREAFFLSVMARYVVALAHIGVIHEINEGRITSFNDLVNSPKVHKAVVDQIIEDARSLVREEYEREMGKGANARLNMSQSAETWKNLSTSLKQRLVSRASS
jgi:hypothetical protein